MENIEATEETPFTQVTDKKKAASDSKKKPQSDGSGKKKKAKYYCTLHGPNYTHDTEDCRASKNGPTKTGGSGKGSHPNKTWTRKSEESSDKSKKELAALVAKAVTSGMKKELASVSKKRKNDKDENECFLLDTLTKDLDGFNYDDMEKMSINDEYTDEVSV
jgi:hypothetical protein